MTFTRDTTINGFEMIPRMPSWITSARAETLEDVAFLSGAALCHLHLVLGAAEVKAVLRQAEGGVPVAQLCREYGMSDALF